MYIFLQNLLCKLARLLDYSFVCLRRPNRDNPWGSAYTIMNDYRGGSALLVQISTKSRGCCLCLCSAHLPNQRPLIGPSEGLKIFACWPLHRTHCKISLPNKMPMVFTVDNILGNDELKRSSRTTDRKATMGSDEWPLSTTSHQQIIPPPPYSLSPPIPCHTFSKVKVIASPDKFLDYPNSKDQRFTPIESEESASELPKRRSSSLTSVIDGQIDDDDRQIPYPTAHHASQNSQSSQTAAASLITQWAAQCLHSAFVLATGVSQESSEAMEINRKTGGEGGGMANDCTTNSHYDGCMNMMNINPLVLHPPLALTAGTGFPLFQHMQKTKRIRTAFSPFQLVQLEQAFRRSQYLVGSERKQLAKQLMLSETQVKVWFQNRRTKSKRFIDGIPVNMKMIRSSRIGHGSDEEGEEEEDEEEVDDG